MIFEKFKDIWNEHIGDKIKGSNASPRLQKALLAAANGDFTAFNEAKKILDKEDFYNQYKTPEQRKFLIDNFKRNDESEEEFFANMPSAAWLLNFENPTKEDLEWGKKVLLGSRKTLGQIAWEAAVADLENLGDLTWEKFTAKDMWERIGNAVADHIKK